MANGYDEPRRRKTDRLNGKMRTWGIAVGWAMTLAILLVNIGMYMSGEAEQRKDIGQLETDVRAIRTVDGQLVANLAALTASVGSLTRSVERLHNDLRSHDESTRD